MLAFDQLILKLEKQSPCPWIKLVAVVYKMSTEPKLPDPDPEPILPRPDYPEPEETGPDVLDPGGEPGMDPLPA